MNRNALVAFFWVATAILAGSASVSAAFGAGGDSATARLPLRRFVPPFEISGLVDSKDKPLEGRIIQAFYVVARLSGIGTPGQTLKIRKIVGPVAKAEINEDGVASFPEASVPSYGDRICNFVVFAIAKDDAKELYFRNSDGTFPTEDPRYPRIPPAKLAEKLAKLAAEQFATEKTGYVAISDLLIDELPRDAAGKITEIRPVEINASLDLWPAKKSVRRAGGGGGDSAGK